jgi:hypothetical protein
MIIGHKGKIYIFTWNIFYKCIYFFENCSDNCMSFTKRMLIKVIKKCITYYETPCILFFFTPTTCSSSSKIWTNLKLIKKKKKIGWIYYCNCMIIGHKGKIYIFTWNIFINVYSYIDKMQWFECLSQKGFYERCKTDWIKCARTKNKQIWWLCGTLGLVMLRDYLTLSYPKWTLI